MAKPTKQLNTDKALVNQTPANNAEANTTDLPENNVPHGGFISGDEAINFMRFRKPMAIISFIVVLIGIISIFTKGLNLGLDFTGGVSAEINYAHPVKVEQVITALHNSGFKEAIVQNLGTQQDLLVRLPPQKESDISHKLSTALQIIDNPVKVSKVDAVGSQVGSELYLRSLGAIALSLGLMLVYVAIRFEMKLAIGAVISLLHDTLFTVGVFSIFGWPFDLSVLAAVLALIGYSLNDTIVVFDRVRENFRKIRGADTLEIVNISLTETLRRTIMTVATVLLVVLAMFFLGGEGLYWFSVALLVGLFAGTYSSVYIATAYAIAMGLNRQDFIIKAKQEFAEEMVEFNDKP